MSSPQSYNYAARGDGDDADGGKNDKEQGGQL